MNSRATGLAGRLGAGLVCVLLAAGASAAETYLEARRDAIASYRAGDYAAMERHVRVALGFRPDYPGMLFNLALSQALQGQAPEALQTLGELASRKLFYDVSEAEEFAAVRELPGFAEVARRFSELNQPRGRARVFRRLDEPDFIPEGIALDTAGNLYLGSIRKARIERIDPSGEAHVLVGPRQDGIWSVFGLAVDESGRRLWAASAAVPQLEGVSGQEIGRSGLFCFDLKTGGLLGRYLLPADDRHHVLGDLLLLDADTLLTTDSLTGAVYRLDADGAGFETIVEPGRLGSPQGLALEQDGRSLLVADYIGGLYRVDLATGQPRRLEAPADASLYGIDGLYRSRSRLIAIQNGIAPHRVSELVLSEDGNRVLRSRILAAKLPEFSEPTLGVVHGGSFVFTANSQWNRFDADHRLPSDGSLRGPVILAIELPAPAAPIGP